MEDYQTYKGLGDSLKILSGKGKDPQGVIYSGDRLLKCKNNKITSYVVPQGVKVICDKAFKGKSKLKEIILPEGLEAIGHEAFAGCTSLESLKIPATMVEIGIHSIPSTLTELVFSPESKSVPMKKNSFWDPGKSKTPSNKVLIRLQRALCPSVAKELGKFANVQKLNDRPPINVGLNPYGQQLTWAVLSMELTPSEGVITFDGSSALVFTKALTKFTIRLTDSQGRVIFTDHDFFVDGDINGYDWQRIKKFDIKNLNSASKEVIVAHEDETGIFVREYFFSRIKSALRQRPEEKYKEDVTLYTDGQPIKLECKIRLIDGVFDSSKLNFIHFPTNGPISRKNIYRVVADDPFALNYLVYDNRIYETKLVSVDSLKGETYKVRLTSVTSYDEDTFNTYVQVIEQTIGTTPEYSTTWFRKPQSAGPLLQYFERDIIPVIYKRTSKVGFRFKKKADIEGLSGFAKLLSSSTGTPIPEVSELIANRWFIKPRFESARNFANGMAAVYQKDGYFFINEEGRVITETFSSRVTDFSGNLIGIELRGEGVWTFLDRFGNRITPRTYKKIKDPQDGMFIIEKDNGYSYVNDYGKYIEGSFELAYPFWYGLGTVLITEESKRLINKAGEIVFRTSSYWHICAVENNQILAWKTVEDYEDGVCDVMDIDGNIIAIREKRNYFIPEFIILTPELYDDGEEYEYDDKKKGKDSDVGEDFVGEDFDNEDFDDDESDDDDDFDDDEDFDDNEFLG